MNKLKGFTLSEILIAMLVLGIIIAASVPVILQMSPNKNAIMMKKAYYATETIIEGLINDITYYPNDEDGFNDNTIIKIPGTAIDIPTTNKLQCLFASKLNIKEDLSALCQDTTNPFIVTTMDGMTWNLSAMPNNGANGTLQIDVDGINNGVAAYNLSTGKGACGTVDTWSPTACDSNLTNQQKKKFDRIQITINKDGSIAVRDNQDALIDILSGKTKLIGGDED